MIKIGFFLGSVSRGAGGVSSYADLILRLLAQNANRLNILLKVYCSQESALLARELCEQARSQCEIVVVPKWVIGDTVTSRLFDFLERLDRFCGKRKKFYRAFNLRRMWFQRLGLDLLHVPYQVAPVYSVKYPVVVTMHDVQELHFPKFFTPDERVSRAILHSESLRKSSAVIVSYDHIKQDIIDYFQLDKNRVHVCRFPVSKLTLPTPSHYENDDYSHKHSFPNGFLLYPAQTWIHKNHITLIKSLEYLKLQKGLDVQLICTGEKKDYFSETLEPYLKFSVVAKNVRFLGLVSSQELFWLYSHCSLVVIPTLYEAGSFPLVEAMTLRAPVICSNVTSLPATIQDERFVFDPLDSNALASLILKMMTDSSLRDVNIANSIARIAEMAQIDSALDFVALYSSLLN